MKALSLKQPWAELILQGKKKIEIRKWNTKFRGEFLIHASKTPDDKSMEEFCFEKQSLPLGFIVGKAELVEVKNYRETKDSEEDKDKHLASADWGCWGFVLQNVERLRPIKANGMLGFWDFDYS